MHVSIDTCRRRVFLTSMCLLTHAFTLPVHILSWRHSGGAPPHSHTQVHTHGCTYPGRHVWAHASSHTHLHTATQMAQSMDTHSHIPSSPHALAQPTHHPDEHSRTILELGPGFLLPPLKFRLSRPHQPCDTCPRLHQFLQYSPFSAHPTQY